MIGKQAGLYLPGREKLSDAHEDFFGESDYAAAMSDEKGRVFPTMKPQDKADRTTQVVREIAERNRRESVVKTAKLKALRLARDAEADPAPPVGKKPKR